MEEEKSPDDIRSTKSDTNSIETVVSNNIQAVPARNESCKMGRNKAEYAGARRKTEQRMTWNPEKHSHTMQLMQNDLAMGLRHCLSGDEREVLNQALRPSTHILWYKVIGEVKSDLLNALAATYPAMRMEVYGSTLMGVAFKDSGLDFYINLFPKSTPSDTHQVIKDATELLQKSQYFANLVAIVSVCSPILNCLHIRTGYYCHLNFFDPIITIKTPILAHLLTFDARIDFLATVIKWWMKVHHCYGMKRISNYALMWMLVFYLQSIPLPIIPPIIQFQSHVPEMIINDFNLAFNYNYPNHTRNKQRCAELLLGFFKFYDRFDFENMVICPLFGRAFAKNDVKAKKVAEFAKYEAILQRNQDKQPLQMRDCICIQDPFEITNSIPVEFAPKVFSRFTEKMAFAVELIEYELHENGESTSLFLSLFNVDLFHKKADEKYQAKQCFANY